MSVEYTVLCMCAAVSDDSVTKTQDQDHKFKTSTKTKTDDAKIHVQMCPTHLHCATYTNVQIVHLHTLCIVCA